jgi:hypothetical protein
MAEPMLCYRRFVRMSKAFVLVVLFYSGLSLLLVRGDPWGMILPQITHPLQECGTATPLRYLRRTLRTAQQYASMPCTCSIPKGQLCLLPYRHRTHRSHYVFRAPTLRAPTLAVVCTVTDLRVFVHVIMNAIASQVPSTAKPKDVVFQMLKVQWLYIVINCMLI